ncbi:MAG: hypothetical protein ABI254_11085, partial [Chthoniobacterales bacterium]
MTENEYFVKFSRFRYRKSSKDLLSKGFDITSPYAFLSPTCFTSYRPYEQSAKCTDQKRCAWLR